MASSSHLIVVAGAVSNTRTALQLTNRVLKCAGLGIAQTIEDESDLETLQALEFVNDIQQELYDNIGLWRFSHAEILTEIIVGQANYEMPEDFLSMRAKPMIGDVKLTFRPLDRLRREYSNIEGEGSPVYYNYDSGDFRMVPVPGADFMRQRLVKNGAAYYICIKQHTAGEDDEEPGVGANWETYWVVTTSSTTTEEWASGAVYKIGRLSIPYHQTPMQLATNGAVSALGPEFYPALVQGACWLMKDWLGRDDAEVRRSESRYSTLFIDRLVKARAVHDLPERETTNLGYDL